MNPSIRFVLQSIVVAFLAGCLITIAFSTLPEGRMVGYVPQNVPTLPR